MFCTVSIANNCCMHS